MLRKLVIGAVVGTVAGLVAKKVIDKRNEAVEEETIEAVEVEVVEEETIEAVENEIVVAEEIAEEMEENMNIVKRAINKVRNTIVNVCVNVCRKLIDINKSLEDVNDMSSKGMSIPTLALVIVRLIVGGCIVVVNRFIIIMLTKIIFLLK